MLDIIGIFNKIKGIISNVPKIVAETSHFSDIVHTVLPIFSDKQQDELKADLAAARQRSDEAQDDFVKASRGQ